MKRNNRRDFILSAIIMIAGFAISGMSLTGMSLLRAAPCPQMAQGTQPPPSESSPKSPEIPAGKDREPADSMPGGTRPTAPAPEPARPDSDAQKAGAQPALPPAPAEKMGEPIRN